MPVGGDIVRGRRAGWSVMVEHEWAGVLFAAGAEAVDFSAGAFAAAECFEAFDLIFGKDGIDAFFDVGEFTALSECNEGDGSSLLVGGESTSPSDSVDVVIAVLGNVIVDNV